MLEGGAAGAREGVGTEEVLKCRYKVLLRCRYKTCEYSNMCSQPLVLADDPKLIYTTINNGSKPG